MKYNVMTLKKDKYFPSQWEFLTNKNKCSISGFLGGYGSGKTHILLAKIFWCLITKKNKDGVSNGLVLYPTYSLAEEVFVEPFREILERNGIPYTYNIAAHRFKTPYGNIKIYQTRYPQRIVGSSYTYCGIDELDIETRAYAKLSVQKALGRLRGCEDAELFITSTPEGYSYLWELFVEQSSPDKLLVHGKTTDNHYLPKSYIQSLKDNYDEQLLKAYLEGNFVNLTQGNTYYGFKRDLHTGEYKYNRYLPLHVGFDFNVHPECAIITQKQSDGTVHCIKEVVLDDAGDGDLLTQRMCDTIKSLFPNNTYYAYPDATGSAKNSSSTFSDISLIRRNSFIVKVNHINPRVINRVNAVNNMFSKNRIKIDKSCKTLIKDLEQVTNKEGTREIDKSNKALSHSSDALGYYISYCFPITKPIIGVQDR